MRTESGNWFQYASNMQGEKLLKLIVQSISKNENEAKITRFDSDGLEILSNEHKTGEENHTELEDESESIEESVSNLANQIKNTSDMRKQKSQTVKTIQIHPVRYHNVDAKISANVTEVEQVPQNFELKEDAHISNHLRKHNQVSKKRKLNATEHEKTHENLSNWTEEQEKGNILHKSINKEPSIETRPNYAHSSPKITYTENRTGNASLTVSHTSDDFYRPPTENVSRLPTENPINSHNQFSPSLISENQHTYSSMQAQNGISYPYSEQMMQFPSGPFSFSIPSNYDYLQNHANLQVPNASPYNLKFHSDGQNCFPNRMEHGLQQQIYPFFDLYGHIQDPSWLFSKELQTNSGNIFDNIQDLSISPMPPLLIPSDSYMNELAPTQQSSSNFKNLSKHPPENLNNKQ